MEKSDVSNVEESRERFEEPISTIGRAVRMEQIWRDSNMLPKNAPSVESLYDSTDDFGNSYKYSIIKRFNDGATIINLIKYLGEVKLNRIGGTINCFNNNDLLKDIMTERFGDTYCPKIYVDGKQIAYGLGKPIFDEAAGTLYFSDKEFSESIKNRVITIDFYKYVGRKGTSSTNQFDNADLPFRDSLKHFKNELNNDQTATIKVRGDVKNTNYILPPENGKYYHKGEDKDTGVVLLQENLEDTLWVGNTKISGGRWEELNPTTKRVYRYFPDKVGETVVDEGEPIDINRPNN